MDGAPGILRTHVPESGHGAPRFFAALFGRGGCRWFGGDGLGCGRGRRRCNVRRWRRNALDAECGVNEVENEGHIDCATDLVAIDEERGGGVDLEPVAGFLGCRDAGGVLLGDASVEFGHVYLLELALVVGDLVEVLVDER